MELIHNIMRITGELIQEIAERIGLGEKWEAFVVWLKADKTHRQGMFAAAMLLLALLILVVYTCSQRPDL